MFSHPLRFVSLGGTESINKNMHVYEHGDDVLIVDCGIDFPDPTMFGVDKILPDFSYVLKKKSQVKGILVTHGHEDHFGALPFLLSKINVPVYCTKLVGGFIRDALKELHLQDRVKLNIINPEKEILTLGAFTVVPFRVNHSVPDSVGYIIKTPVGKIFHISDFKFDWTPVQDPPFDLARVALEAKQDVLALVGDCLGVNEEGYTQSERMIEETFRLLMQKAKNQVFVTTISSNISRMQQAINVSSELGRKVVFVGRSVREKTSVARELGYLTIRDSDLISERRAKNFPQEKLTYLISGSYGQPGSALWHVAHDFHNFVSLKKSALVIFSADPAPPESKIWVDKITDQLMIYGADVHYYDIQENLHVSGHASRGDLSLLIGIIRPKFFIPIGGTLRHMRAFKGLVEEVGQDPKKVFELPEGQAVEFFDNQARLAKKIKLKDVLIGGFEKMDEETLRERQGLSQSGVVAVSITLSSGGKVDVEMSSLGFVLQKDYPDVFRKAKEEVREVLAVNRKRSSDVEFLKTEVGKRLEKFFHKATRIMPTVLITLHQI